jgi:hypothetical protein
MNITQIYTHPSRYKPRGAQAPVAIILHEVNEPLGALGARIGTNLINALKPTAHQSYHYALDGAAVHAFVDPAQAARALDDAEVLVDWTPQAGFPGVDPDLYTINIAVIVGSFPIGDNLCIPCCGREYPAIIMWNLRRLLHSIAAEYDISLADDMLWLHNDELCDICLDDLRIPPEIVTPGEEDWLCDRLADLCKRRCPSLTSRISPTTTLWTPTPSEPMCPSRMRRLLLAIWIPCPPGRLRRPTPASILTNTPSTWPC